MGARSFASAAVVKESRIWSSQQEAIFRWFEGYEDYDNLVVVATAGSGKSTTLVEGVNRAPEESGLVCAFNKPIAEVLQAKISRSGMVASTIHAASYAYVRRRWRGMPVDRAGRRAEALTNAVVPKDTPKQIKRLVSLLHTKVREMIPMNATIETVHGLALFFNLIPDEGYRGYDLNWVVAAGMAATKYAFDNEPTYDIGIDFADMVFLPLAYNLLTKDYGIVVVDEAQDMSAAQLMFAQRVCSGRICIVGDPFQAIYGFRGADSTSIARLKQELGAQELTLSTTYRCAQSIVRKAQALVPAIQAGATNPEGVVDNLSYWDLMQQAKAGDFILSRINAPLVAITLHLLKAGKRARMKGRDIGATIQTLLKRLGAEYVALPALTRKLDTWERETVTRFASFNRLDLVDRTRDEATMLRYLMDGATDTQDLLTRIDWLFSDNVEEGTITCSSVHKAKGLEADRVFVLQESFYRRGKTQEEMNCEYVATTRAKNHLSYVSGVPNL